MKKISLLFSAIFLMLSISAYAYKFDPKEWTDLGPTNEDAEGCGSCQMWVKNKADIDKDGIPHVFLMTHFLKNPQQGVPADTKWVLSEALVDCKERVILPIHAEAYDETLQHLLAQGDYKVGSSSIAVNLDEADDAAPLPAREAYYKACGKPKNLHYF